MTSAERSLLQPSRRPSLKKTGSFKIRRMGDIVVCETCGQGHQPGRNHLYDYPDNIDEDLLCRVCRQPLVDPVDTPCAHTFCQACLRSHMRMQKTCPFDGRPLLRDTDVRRSSTLVRNILDKLTVVCPNNGYCDQLMPRHALEVHLRYQCPGTYVPCPRREEGGGREGEGGGCDFVGPRSQLEEHLWSCTHGSDVDPKSDIVVQIDRQDLTHMTLAQATLALGTSSPLLRLGVYRPSLEDRETDLVELEKQEGQPLGIQIRTSRSRPGIYVHYLVPGSRAEESASLRPGDRILEVNGKDLRNSTVDEAAAYMMEATGTLKFLISRQDLASVHSSASSESSYNPSPTGISPSTGGPIYDEIMAPSGYQIGTLKSVVLKKKSEEPFGMNVAGGAGGTVGDLPIFISAVKPDSVIGRSRKIQKGDILLSINDKTLVGKTHGEAIESVRGLMGCEVVRMELIQGEETDINGGLSPDWGKWLRKWEADRRSPLEFSVTLKKVGQKILGFSIVGGKNSSRGHSPLFIRSIAPNSVASEDGRLHSGDRITQINGTEVWNLSQSEAVELIKTSRDTITLTIIPRNRH